MAVDITIQVSEELGRKLEQYRDQLPDVLEVGLRALLSATGDGIADERAIVTLLASQPTPEQILALEPSAGLQSRVGELIQRSKDGALSREEDLELERYLFLDHLVRLAKTGAIEQLAAREG